MATIDDVYTLLQTVANQINTDSTAIQLIYTLPTLVEMEASTKIAKEPAGANHITFTIREADTTPIEGVCTTIYNSTRTIFITRKYTDTTGQFSVDLDNGAYQILYFKVGYEFDSTAYVNIQDTTSINVTGTSFMPNPIVIPGLQTVWGRFIKIDGNPDKGVSVSAMLAKYEAIDENLLSNTKLHTFTDDNGYFELYVIPNITTRFTISNYGTQEVLITSDVTKNIKDYYGF